MGRPRDEIYKRLEPQDAPVPELAYDYGLQAKLPNRRIQLWREADGSVMIITKRLLQDRRIGMTASHFTKEAAQVIADMLAETREQRSAGREEEAVQ